MTIHKWYCAYSEFTVGAEIPMSMRSLYYGTRGLIGRVLQGGWWVGGGRKYTEAWLAGGVGELRGL